MREQLINDMKSVFGDDDRRIDHALSVLSYADQIRVQQGGDESVVTAAAILHDIGIHEAERKYGSAAGKYQEIEGPSIAKGILEKYEITADTVEHVCRIVGSHHSGGDIDTVEFRVIWDADWIVNIGDDLADAGQEKLEGMIDKVFKTGTGRSIAKKRFVKN